MFDGFRRRLGIKKHNHAIDVIADVNGIVSGIALYPQLLKVMETKSVSDLEPLTFFIVFLTSIIWFAYAIHRRALPVILASILNLIASGWIIGFFFVFKNGV